MEGKTEMGLTVKDIFKLVNRFAPFDLAESWDNSGLQAGAYSWPVSKVLVALDASLEVMEAAVSLSADVVITHHPVTIQGEKSFDFDTVPGRIFYISAVNKIALISMHTNLDVVHGGLNDHFAKLLQLKGISSFKIGKDQACVDEKQERLPSGLGRVGRLEIPLTLMEFASKVKQALGARAVRVAGASDTLISKVTVCTGSGGSLIKDFLSSDSQVYVTGDIKYHEARIIEQSGRCLIDAGHFSSEYIVISYLVDLLGSVIEPEDQHIEIIGYHGERDPFVIV